MLVQAPHKGALAKLTTLYLRTNQTGDEGMKAFSPALSNGALGSLIFLSLGDNLIIKSQITG